MIHLVYGLPGTGKTTFLYQEIQKNIKNGEKAFLIVPEQQTVEVERIMSRLLPPSAQLSFEVLNFTRLADKVFRLYGGLSYHYITGGMKNLFMWQTVRLLAPYLKEYREDRTFDRTFPEMMLSAIGELKAADVAPTDLENAAKQLPEGSPLKDKLGDLSLIYTAYEGIVSESYDDASNDLAKLATILERQPFFEDYHVYIDSFFDFTAQEYKIIRRIFSQARSTTVTLLCDSPETDAIHLAGIRRTSDRLRNFAGDDIKITCLDRFHRFSSPELERIAASLWDFSVQGYEPLPEEQQGAIKLFSCADAYEEAKAAAAQVLSLVQNGYRYKEIAVIARNAEQYRGILDAEFEKAGIPFFMSEKTDITAKPLISMIFSALAIKQKGYRRGDVISYLKAGFCGFSDYELDIFEDYVTRWGISGRRFLEPRWNMNPDGYDAHLSKQAEEMISVANETKNKFNDQLSTFFSSLERAKTAGEFCDALYRFLVSLDIATRLREDAAILVANGDRKEAAESASSFRALVKVLTDITKTLGNAEMTLDEFASALRLVLDGTDIGTIPTAADEVLIGSASMLRTTDIRHAILVGLCEGEFPNKVAESGIFSDADRLALKAVGVSLSGNSVEKTADELLYAYRSMTMPSEGLTLIYRKAQIAGGACHPSLALRRVASLLKPTEEIPYASLSAAERLRDKESAMEALSLYGGTPEGVAIRAVLSEDPQYAERLALRDRSFADPTCYVSKKTADAVFGKDLMLSQSRLEAYVSCHFQYYCRYVLGLRESERAEFSYKDIGTFIHRVLEIFMKETAKKTIDPDRDMDIIKDIVSREIESFSKEVFRGDERTVGRIAHLLVRLYRLSTLVAVTLCREQMESRFLPRFFELCIDKDSELGITPPTITLEDGSSFSLRGKIDRVDTFEKDEKLYIRVVDYKTGKKEFSLEDIKQGFNLQLLLYLFAICDSNSPVVKRAAGVAQDTPLLPAGAVYLSTATSDIDTTPSEQVESVLAKASGEIKRSGILLDDEDILCAMSASKNSRVLAGGSKSFTAESDFPLLKDELYRTIENISREMKTGNASATPVEHDGRVACEYCKIKQFCRAASAVGISEQNEGASAHGKEEG